MRIPVVVDLLWCGGILLEMILAARLWMSRLARRYPVTSVYLGFAAIRSIALVCAAHSGARLFGLQGYGVMYLVTQPLVWMFYFLLILEFYSRMTEEFPGIRRLGRLVSLSALFGAALVCCVLAACDEHAGAEHYPFLSYLFLQQRSVFFCLSALTLLLLLFAAHYRLPVCRNVWILYACFGGYFLVNALLFTLRRYFGEAFASSRDLLGNLAYFVSLLGGCLFVSRGGEKRKQPISDIWGTRNRELEEALCLQLRSFNQVLVKVLKQ
jgi:hypothetical protein